MTVDPYLACFAVLAAAHGAAAGPLRLAVRGMLRWRLAACGVRRWQRPATLGLAAGMVAATAAAAVLGGGQVAAAAAVAGLLGLLAAIDLAWRWLPVEWTGGVMALGLSAAAAGGTLPAAVLGALAGAVPLILLQAGFRRFRRVEALGTGDIWLAAGLGTLAGPLAMPWLLGLAAVAGICTELIARQVAGAGGRRRSGVAYGAHLAAVFPLILFF